MGNYSTQRSIGKVGLALDYSFYGIEVKGALPADSYATVSKTGQKVPGWQNLIKKGIAASSPYDLQFANLKQPGWIDVKAIKLGTSGDYARYYGWYSDSPQAPSSEDTLCRDIALIKIKKKMQSDRADAEVMANMLQDVYEFKKTIFGTLDSIEDLLKKISTRLSRTRSRGARSGLIENIADLWLEFAFGINPTIKDMQELAEAIDKMIHRKDSIKRFQASHYIDTQGGTSRTIVAPFGGLRLQYQENVARTISYKYIAGVKYNIFSAVDYGAIARNLHFMPTDIIPTLWELLPWSWVIDYFATVGDVISDYFQSDPGGLVYTIEDAFTHNHYYSSIKATVDPGWVLAYNRMTPRFLEKGHLARTVAPSLPHRLLRWRTPYEVENNLNKKLANLTAVLVGLVSGNASRSARRP